MKSKPGLITLLMLTVILISACSVEPIPATATPDPCTGWTCTIEGIIYQDAAASGNELAGVEVDFEQISNCSLTKGAYQLKTDQEGRFSVEVFLHDTDSFVIEVNEGGYQAERVLFGGFDCLYCSCPPTEMVLTPEE